MNKVTSSAVRPDRQHGFVLVMTLWVLVIVAIATAYFSERVTQAVELAQQSRQNTSAMVGMASTRAEILYRLGTTSLTEYGLGRGNAAIGLDNRPYRGLGGSLLRLQDSRGLLNLNHAEDDTLQRFLGLIGIPAEQRGHMIDTLRDYTQASKLHRLNGAGDEDYATQNLALPSHQNLITPWEARRIIGWRDASPLWQNARLVELSATGVSMGLNPNTAPAEVLSTLPGATAEKTQLVIARRTLTPITDVRELAELLGLPAQQIADQIGVIPSNSIRITQSTAGVSWSVQYNITLTPKGSDTPWRIDYQSRVSTNQADGAQTSPIDLPPRSKAPPEALPL